MNERKNNLPLHARKIGPNPSRKEYTFIKYNYKYYMYSSRQKIYQDLRSQLSPHRMLTLSLLNLLQIDGNVAGISGEVFFWCDTLNTLFIFFPKTFSSRYLWVYWSRNNGWLFKENQNHSDFINARWFVLKFEMCVTSETVVNSREAHLVFIYFCFRAGRGWNYNFVTDRIMNVFPQLLCSS